MGATPKSIPVVDDAGSPSALDSVLRARIASHEIAPGAKLREQAIADEFGVSRARVRDALATLAQRGLVERFPGRGAVVLRFDFASTVQVLEMREVLEALAVRLATRNAAQGSWDDLAALFAQPQMLGGTRNDLSKYVKCYETFRTRVMQAAANPQLADSLGALHDKTKVVMRRVLAVSDRPAAALAEHRGVLAAMCAGQAARAETLRRKSLAGARDYLVRYREFLF
ncbi:MAG: GntR family transcriptional regulator [Casimicrobiaceae bacterium]